MECDYCGEYCSALGVNAVEHMDVEVTEDELDPADLAPIDGESEFDRENRLYDLCQAKERVLRSGLGAAHRELVERRMACATDDGGELSPAEHAGPRHDDDGRPLDDCPTCSDDSEWDFGDWDSTLDHTDCIECWADVAGGGALLKRRRTATDVSAADEPTTTNAHLSTEPADRRRVEAAFATYLEQPLPIRWVSSPIEVVRAIAGAGHLDAGGRWSVWRADEALARAIEEGDFDLDTDLFAGGEAIVGTLASGLAAHDLGGLETRPQLVAEILADAGQFDPRPNLILSLEADGEALEADDEPIEADEALVRLLSDVCASSGPLIFLASEIVASERPLVLKLDDRGRPHSDAGPAIAYGDGLAVHAHHGIAVPSWLIDEPERLDVAAIDAEPNVEVRRVMIERFGAERLVREGGADLVHEDETGRLWRRPVGQETIQRHGRQVVVDAAIVMVEVINTTPEPDGTHKTYFLRVPPTMKTARGAVAWTFGMEGTEYRPDRES